VVKLCATEVARTGLNEREATAAGFDYVVAKTTGTTRASYFPGKKSIEVKLVVERVTGRLLGGQIVGEEGAAKRVDVLATAITAGMTANDLLDLDLGYAPPFSPLWDPVQSSARKAMALV
jgi:NADPH-dependent 2,4-dienoyl-CoA reductase/sulfur reductase-like enzyme